MWHRLHRACYGQRMFFGSVRFSLICVDILCIFLQIQSNLPCEAGATWFIPNQSITGSHLENVKMVNFAYQWESSRPKEHTLPVKQWLRDFVYVLSGLFRNPRWPPSAILDFLTYPKMIFLTSKWPKEDILCIFWPITCPVKPVPHDLSLINQSLAAILKT